MVMGLKDLRGLMYRVSIDPSWVPLIARLEYIRPSIYAEFPRGIVLRE